MPTGGGAKNIGGSPIQGQSLSFFDPTNSDNRGSLIQSQQSPSSPAIAALDSGSGLHLPDKPAQHRTDHFPEDIYDLAPTSHLMRFLAALLGDAGTGQLRKRYAVAQFQQALTSSHFYDLDRFYGAIFNTNRTPDEDLSAAQFNPYTDPATADDWDLLNAADASYRERINALAKAIAMGATRPGLLAACEAVVGCECDLYEGFTLIDALGDRTVYAVTDPFGDGSGGLDTGSNVYRTWGQMATDFTNYGSMEAESWIGLQYTPAGGSGTTTVGTDQTYGGLAGTTYLTMHGSTWYDLEHTTATVGPSSGGGPTAAGNPGWVAQDGPYAYLTRYSFQIRPKRDYDLLYPDPIEAASARAEDEDAIRKVVNVLKPAGAMAIVDTSGIELHVPVTPGHVAADSEYWEITSEVRPAKTVLAPAALYPVSKHQAVATSPYTGLPTTAADPHPLPQYAFAEKQGEDWSYASEVVTAVSYTQDVDGNPLAADTRELVTYSDGQVVDYTADHGLLDPTQALAGKYAASGVTVAAPYSDTRVQVPTSG